MFLFSEVGHCHMAQASVESSVFFCVSISNLGIIGVCTISAKFWISNL